VNAIEPHWIQLLWFAACSTVCMLALLTVAGMFPWRSRPEIFRKQSLARIPPLSLPEAAE